MEEQGPELWEYCVCSDSLSVSFYRLDGELHREDVVWDMRDTKVLDQKRRVLIAKLGMDGWELVSVHGAVDSPQWYFKRRI